VLDPRGVGDQSHLVDLVPVGVTEIQIRPPRGRLLPVELSQIEQQVDGAASVPGVGSRLRVR